MIKNDQKVLPPDNQIEKEPSDNQIMEKKPADFIDLTQLSQPGSRSGVIGR